MNKPLTLSVPHFPHLQSGHTITSNTVVFFWGMMEVIQVSSLMCSAASVESNVLWPHELWPSRLWSMVFFRQQYWSGLPFPTPGDLPNPGIKSVSLASLALTGTLFTTSTTWPTPVFLPGKSLWTKEPGGLQSMGSQRVRHDGEIKHNTAQRHLRSPVWCYLMVKLRLGIWSKKLRAISET